MENTVDLNREEHLLRVNTLYDVLNAAWFKNFPEHPELNEGIFTNGFDTSYDEAMENVYQWFIDKGKIKKGTRVLEIGFGYGVLGQRIKATGASWTGVNNNKAQCDYAKRNGLNVNHMDWNDIGEDFYGKFDVIVIRGCLEHALMPTEAASGQAKVIYGRLMENLAKCFDPKSKNRRFVMSMMCFRYPVDYTLFLKPHTAYPKYSGPWFLTRISQTWGGCYPNSYEDVYGTLLDRFNVVDEVEDTKDYYYTSVCWGEKYKTISSMLRTAILCFKAKMGLKHFFYMASAFNDNVWTWQWVPLQDCENFSDTFVMNKRWVLEHK